MSDMASFNLDLEKYYWWDSPECKYIGERSFKAFYNDKANWTFLEERAKIFENWTDAYNICPEDWETSTTIVDIYFEEGMPSPFYNNSWNYNRSLNDFLYNETSKFRKVRDIIPIHTPGMWDTPFCSGTYMASLAFHYAVACKDGDIDDINEVLRKLKRPVDGLHILTHVSGLDGNLARFAVKDTSANRVKFKDFFYKKDANDEYTIERQFGREDNVYPGQGIYTDWWYKARTSRDQHIGMFFGYGITYKLLSETTAPNGVNTTLREYILNMIDNDGSDVLDRLISSNWHVINGEAEVGGGRGFDEASLHPRIPWVSGGEILIPLLKFGKIINPNKYTRYYNKIINRFGSTMYIYASDQSGAYYGNNLAFDIMFLNYFINEDPAIREIVRNHYNKEFYNYIQYHRSSLFNLGWLILNNYDLENEILGNERLLYRLDDITDNLNRFANWRFPSRDWYIPRVEDAEDLVHPKAKMYNEIFAEDSDHIFKTLYGWIFEHSDTSAKSMIALGADEVPAEDYLWQRAPFSLGGTQSGNPNYKGTKQHPGIDYTLTYWMGRYFEYFKES